MRLGHRVDGVVPVQDLRLLAGPDADADRGAELVVAQHLIQDTEQQRVGGERVERAGLGEQGVDPLGGEPFEGVPPGAGGLQDPVQVGAGPLHGVRGHQARHDHVAVIEQASGYVLAGAHQADIKRPGACRPGTSITNGRAPSVPIRRGRELPAGKGAALAAATKGLRRGMT
jgi:hypothetical protein